MRTTLLAFLMAAALAGIAPAAEKTTFLDGVVSLEIPEGWAGRMDERQLALSVIRLDSPTTMVVFSTPNVNVNGDPAVILGRNADLMYMFFGDDFVHDAIEKNAGMGGKKGMAMNFTAARDNVEFRGRAFAFAAAGGVVLALDMCLAGEYDANKEFFDKMLASFAIDPQAMKDNAGHIQDISDAADDLYDELIADMEERELEDDGEIVEEEIDIEAP